MQNMVFETIVNKQNYQPALKRYCGVYVDENQSKATME